MHVFCSYYYIAIFLINIIVAVIGFGCFKAEVSIQHFNILWLFGGNIGILEKNMETIIACYDILRHTTLYSRVQG